MSSSNSAGAQTRWDISNPFKAAKDKKRAKEAKKAGKGANDGDGKDDDDESDAEEVQMSETNGNLH